MVLSLGRRAGSRAGRGAGGRGGGGARGNRGGSDCEPAGMRSALAITLAMCGTALILAPQVHDAVLGANRLYAAAITSHARQPAAELPEVAPPDWMAPASVALGAALVVCAAVGSAPGRAIDPSSGAAAGPAR